VATRQQQFWTLNSNPDGYRIEDAVNEVEFDNWATTGSPIRAGDRALIWKAKGRHADTTGVVSLAEIVADPAPAPDLHPEYQRRLAPAGDAGALDEMVTIRYVRAHNLPLWLNGPHHDLLATLSVVRGGFRRSVYRVEPEEWEPILAVAGGWPDTPPEAQTAEALVGGRGRSGGQGFSRDVRARQAIERQAMDLATRHYRERDWGTKDVSGREPYDLHCRRGADVLRVEVKGTTSDGAQVFLTRNEVEHAREHRTRVALCIVANIRLQVAASGELEATGGDVRIIEPWNVDEGQLAPLSYSYFVPTRRL